MNPNKDTYDFESFNLILFIRDKFKPILIITVIAAVVSIIVSLLIQPKYKSSVILFPAPAVSLSKSLLGTNITSKTVATFGEEEEVERLMQVLNSDELRQLVIQKHNLMKHYEIDTTSKFPKTQLLKEYEDNVSINRTEFMSIKVEVLDKDPRKAASIANDISAFVDTVMNQMKRERAKKSLNIVENEYQSLQNSIKQLEDSLTQIRMQGVNDYSSQSEVFNEAYAKALLNNSPRAKVLKEKIDILSKYGSAYIAISQFLENQYSQLSDLKARYAEAKVNANKTLSHKLVVNRAHAAEKKSYPVRWLIVVVSTASAFILAIIVLLVLDNIKRVLRTGKK